jgi:hypothetical protein
MCLSPAVRFNAHGPEGLINRKAPGQLSRLTDEHRAALAQMIETGWRSMVSCAGVSSIYADGLLPNSRL